MTIGQVVSEYIAERQEGMDKYVAYLAMAKAGVRELSIYGGNRTLSTATLEPNAATGVYPLPSDCIKILTAAVCVGDGYILLGYDPSMCGPENREAEVYCCTEAPTDDERLESDCDYASHGIWPPYYNQQTGLWFDAFEAGRYVGRQFAVGAGYRHGGVWSVDYSQRIIWIRETCAGGKVVIRYMSNGLSDSGATYIDEAAVEAVKAYINWKRELHDNPGGRRAGVDVKFAEYKRQFNLNFGLRRGTSVQRLLDGTRRQIALGKIKR